jgi:hypothetical protein
MSYRRCGVLPKKDLKGVKNEASAAHRRRPMDTDFFKNFFYEKIASKEH